MSNQPNSPTPQSPKERQPMALNAAPCSTLGQPLAECTDLNFLRFQVEHLYQVLDNIDTASDMFKPRLDEPKTLENYYRFTNKHQQRKSENLVSDGYKLYLLNKK